MSRPRNPGSRWGIGSGESLTINFALEPGMTYDDLIAAIESGELRVGLHVQGFDGGYSEGFVSGGGGGSGGGSSVPEPSSVLLAGPRPPGRWRDRSSTPGRN